MSEVQDYPPEAAALGIVPPERRKSVRYCLQRGQRWVNWPVGLIMLLAYSVILLPMLFGWIPRHISPQAIGNGGLAIVAVFLFYIILGPPLIAWVWWSATISRWRIWALQNVDNWHALENAAVDTKLMWRRGHIFERTEFKSRSQRELERALIRYRDEHG